MRIYQETILLYSVLDFLFFLIYIKGDYVMQQILFVTYQEMNKHGLKFTMDDIAARLGISKKTLYKIFRSKDDLIIAVIQSLISSTEEKEKEILDADLPFDQKLRDFLFMELNNFDYPSAILVRDIHFHHPSAVELYNQFNANRAQHLKKILDEGVQKNLINPVPTDFIALFLSCIAKTIVREDLAHSCGISFQKSLHLAVDIFIRGLSK